MVTPERTMPDGKTLKDEAAETVLARVDHYELIRELGGGGFGTVYLARDTVSGVEYAVKGLPPFVKNSREELENIKANFTLVSRLTHTNIACAHVLHLAKEVAYVSLDVRKKLRVDPGDILMVMEFAPGVTLTQWRRQFPGGKVPIEQALEIVRQIASALDYAHGENVLHRDVKPANVMVETKPDGKLVVRVVDFGLAAEIRTSMGRVSREIHDTSGTRPYMAPEQWLGGRQGPATDQYALAALFHELVTGDVPFASVFGTGDPVVMMNVVGREPFASPTDLSESMRQALEKALAKKPEDRFTSCVDFVAAMSGNAIETHASNRLGPSKPDKAPTLQHPSTFSILKIAVILALLVSAGVGYVILRNQRAQPTQPQSAASRPEAPQPDVPSSTTVPPVASPSVAGSPVTPPSAPQPVTTLQVTVPPATPPQVVPQPARPLPEKPPQVISQAKPSLMVGEDEALQREVDKMRERARKARERAASEEWRLWPHFDTRARDVESFYWNGVKALETNDYPLARKMFAAVRETMYWVSTNHALRVGAASAREQAKASQEEAQRQDAARYARERWQSAVQDYDSATRLFDEGKFKEAQQSFDNARQQFADAASWAIPQKKIAEWKPGSPHPRNPNLVADTEIDTWRSTRPGFAWVKGTDQEAWKPGVQHPDNPRLRSDRQEGTWMSTEEGYEWAGGSRTEWREGLVRGDRKTSSTPGMWLSKCTLCNGKGLAQCESCGGTGMKSVKCDKCDGGFTFRTEKEACTDCFDGRRFERCANNCKRMMDGNWYVITCGCTECNWLPNGMHGGYNNFGVFNPCRQCGGRGLVICPHKDHLDDGRIPVALCSTCNGTRWKTVRKRIRCSTCNGTGTIKARCSNCDDGKAPCSRCRASGWVSTR